MCAKRKLSVVEESVGEDTLIELEEIAYSVRDTYHALVNYLRAYDVFAGEGRAGFRILSILYAHGPISIPQLMRRMACSRQYAQRELMRLRQNGYAKTRANPARKNSALFELTAKGLRDFEHRRELCLDALAEFDGEFSRAELEATTETLKKLQQLTEK